jgi:hypothetical protein
LEYGGASIAAIYASIKHTIDTIDKMANTGAVRATESRTMSGVAMATEFQLLNARLSEMADSLELAEEQLWRFWSTYQGREWTGEIEYPGSFNLRDTNDEIQQLQSARQAATDPAILRAIDYRVMDWLDLTEEEQAELDASSQVATTAPVEEISEHPSLANLSLADRLAHLQEMLMSGYSNDEILALHPEITLQDIVDAGAAAAAQN